MTQLQVLVGVVLALSFHPVHSAAPPSWSRTDLRPLELVQEHVMPPVDAGALAAEDELLEGPGVRPRAGLAMKTDLSTVRAGTWEDLPSGDRLWRLRVSSPGALWVVLGFGTFRLQPGAALWVYPADRRVVLGPFTSADVREHGQLWLPPLEGDAVVVELLWPAALQGGTPNVHLGTVSHGYRSWGGIGAADDGTLAAGACNIDVNCPLGADWQSQKRGVVNLLSGGSGYCTGSLIASTDTACRQFVLTAAHCMNTQSEAASTTFQFNFERPGCSSGVPPTNQTTTGSVLRATYSASDATLVEMDDVPPESFNVFYNGWSRATTAGTQSHCIHHPNNDEKKISFNDDPLIAGINWGPDHWRVTEWEQGTTEPGSSGSPLFDQNKRIVGQLHGGSASCTSITYDEFGKLDVSWTGGGTPATRLSDWLDPAGTGSLTLDGVDAVGCGTPRPRLGYRSHVVDDAAGNGDGIADPGESLVLPITAGNDGTLGATSIGGTLSTTTPTVTITDASASYPDLAAGAQSASIAPHFALTIAASHACGAPLAMELDLTATEDPGAWSSTFSIPTGTPQVTVVFDDLVEAGPGGWTQTAIQGSNPWSIVTSDSFSPTHSWFVADPGTRHDTALVMQTLTNLPSRAVLTFRHRYNTENSYDGGVLETSADGIAWMDAGSRITSGGYSSSIGSGASTNLAGRSVWAGDSGGWQRVEVDLGAFAGGPLQLRWRFATDTSVSDEGWYVDDVHIDSTSYTCSTSFAPPGEASDPDGPGAPFRIDKDASAFLLTWSSPVAGGPAASYRLYRTPLVSGGPAAPTCEADLGTGLSVVLATLTDDSGFLVVARNAAGEGSYGQDSTGAERPRAQGGDVCP